MAVHGTVLVTFAQLVDAIALTRAARNDFDRDPQLALRRLDELEDLLEDFLARLEEHRA